MTSRLFFHPLLEMMREKFCESIVLFSDRFYCFLAFILFPFISLFFSVENLWAQQIPTPAQPERLEQKFEKPPVPKSTLEPVTPEFKEPPVPSKMEEIKFVLKDIVIEGSTVYERDDFLPIYKEDLDQEITLARIYKIAAALTAKYRNEGYLLTKALVPGQRIRDGVVKIEVKEGFVDGIQIEGAIEDDSAAQRSRKRLQVYSDKILLSRPLRAKVLERYLLLINDLPGLKVQSVLTPSETTPGAAKLTLITEHKKLDGFASLDNRGSRFNGPIQATIAANLNSILGLHEKTGFGFTTTSPTSELIYFNGYHEHPLGSEGTRLTLSGSLSFTEPGDTLKSLNVEGESSTISATLSHPFIRSRGKNLSARFGFTRRNSETDILGSLSSRDRLRIFNLGVSYDFIDRYRGVNLVDVEFSQGADIFNATESGSANLSRNLGRSDFSKLVLNLQRLHNFGAGWSFLAEATGQYSFNSLLASEEFGFGGARFGRGYDLFRNHRRSRGGRESRSAVFPASRTQIPEKLSDLCFL